MTARGPPRRWEWGPSSSRLRSFRRRVRAVPRPQMRLWNPAGPHRLPVPGRSRARRDETEEEEATSAFRISPPFRRAAEDDAPDDCLNRDPLVSDRRGFDIDEDHVPRVLGERALELAIALSGSPSLAWIVASGSICRRPSPAFVVEREHRAPVTGPLGDKACRSLPTIAFASIHLREVLLQNVETPGSLRSARRAGERALRSGEKGPARRRVSPARGPRRIAARNTGCAGVPVHDERERVEAGGQGVLLDRLD